MIWKMGRCSTNFGTPILKSRHDTFREGPLLLVSQSLQQHQVYSSTMPKRYELWSGNNSFLCYGSLLLGSQSGTLIAPLLYPHPPLLPIPLLPPPHHFHPSPTLLLGHLLMTISIICSVWSVFIVIIAPFLQQYQANGTFLRYVTNN